MKKRDESIIRVGDCVKITNPEVFIRCGYPLTMEDAIRNHMTQKDSEKIDDLLRGLGIVDDLMSPHRNSRYIDTFDTIVKTLAYAIVGNKNCGGNERSIYTELHSEIKDAECHVINKRVVKTGIRKYEYDYGWDGESSSWYYLDKEETHIILQVRMITPVPILFDDYKPNNESLVNFIKGIKFKPDVNSFEIEKKNVTKLVDKIGEYAILE